MRVVFEILEIVAREKIEKRAPNKPKRLAVKNVSKMICFVSLWTLDLY